MRQGNSRGFDAHHPLQSPPAGKTWSANGRPRRSLILGLGADMKALRDLHRQLPNDVEAPDTPFFRDPVAVLLDRDAMLAILHSTAADSTDRGNHDRCHVSDLPAQFVSATNVVRHVYGRI